MKTEPKHQNHFIKQVKLNVGKPEITIIKEKQGERKLAAKGVNLGGFLLQSGDEIVETQELIVRIIDRRNIIE